MSFRDVFVHCGRAESSRRRSISESELRELDPVIALVTRENQTARSPNDLIAFHDLLPWISSTKFLLKIRANESRITTWASSIM